MAGCYHDTQDFKSDHNIEVAREGDILEVDQNLDEIECDKNPGHRGFIPFKDLTLEHLPIEDRKPEILDKIKKTGSVVVRLVIGKLKNGRQIKEAGSGYVLKFDNKYFIITNNHVVKKDEEVKHCTVEFHYDDDSRSSVLTSRGVELLGACPYRDISAFRFHPVPDFLHELHLEKLPSIVIMYKDNQIVTEVTTLSQTVQLNFLSGLKLNSSLIDLMFLSWPDDSISYLKSSYFKFQPIPSNIQQLTSIKIHIDEHDGNSRVIPGDVVKFGDEFVVKTSESIFQDEVKKYRLVWNGKVIGRGTRLYFQQVKCSDMLSGIDLERNMYLGTENFCILKFHPITRFVEAMLHPSYSNKSNNLCCVGHPHGGIKMATFGRILDVSPEQFDNQYRRITQPGPDCQCKEVNCVKYSCKTCPGSSGSAVFTLDADVNFCSGFSHFMGKKVGGYLPNGKLIENINIAWTPIQGAK